MRFLLTLGLIVSIAFGSNSLYAVDNISLSVSVCLEVNETVEHADSTSITLKPLERKLSVRDVKPDTTLNDILRQYLTQRLGVRSIEGLKAQITQIESVQSSLVAISTGAGGSLPSFSKLGTRSLAMANKDGFESFDNAMPQPISPVDKNCSKSLLLDFFCATYS